MLKLVLGGSGSGKTTLLYARIKARAEAGQRSILLVPEQFTSSTEGRIYRELGDALSGMVDSYSFTSLAEHILSAEGGAAVQTLSDAGRAVLVRRTLEELQDTVQYYYRHRRSAAFCQMAAETIDELKSAGLSGQQLYRLAQGCGSGSGKLTELALILQGYETLLAGTGMDPSDRLELAADRLEAALARGSLPEFLQDRAVFIDEFDTFNAPKKRLLAALLTALPQVTVALCDDGTPLVPGDTGLFAGAKQVAAQLRQLAEEGLVSARSLHVDEENGMVSFAYSCGALGGVLVEDPDEENTPFAPSELPAVDLHEMSNAPQGDLGSAMIYYAFDNTVNSSRYPYYSYMKGFWTAMGLHTRIDTTVTVSDLKRMNDYGLCILSAHGSYYTYTSGFLFKQTRTEPVILLTEESDFYKDLYYGIDLLTHRVIKINGLYCITPSFFRAAYRGGQLKDTVVLSETCEFLGVSGSLDTSMADALLAGGAKAVAGYVNNVYTVYSRSMLWDTVNHLILGQTLQESVQHSMDTYGADDLVWYNAQGGKRPHAAAAYPLLFGDVGVRLIEPNAAPVPQDVQQAA